MNQLFFALMNFLLVVGGVGIVVIIWLCAYLLFLLITDDGEESQ